MSNAKNKSEKENKEVIEVASNETEKAPEVAEVVEKSAADIRKEEILTEVDGLAKDYNALNQDGKPVQPIEKKIKELLAEYTAIVRKQEYKRLGETADPMLEAIKQFHYKTLKAKVETEGEDKIPVMKIVPADREIDLYGLHVAVSGGIGLDKTWNTKISELNCKMAMRIIANTCKTDTLAKMKAAADNFNMGYLADDIKEGKTPLSQTQLTRKLQEIVDATIGDSYKMTSKDVNYIQEVYAKKGKDPRSLITPKPAAFRSCILSFLNSIVTGKDYDAVTPKIKAK